MALAPLVYCWVQFKLSGCYVPVYNVCLNPVIISLWLIALSQSLVLDMISTCILVVAYCSEPVVQFIVPL